MYLHVLERKAAEAMSSGWLSNAELTREGGKEFSLSGHNAV
jgi:hypothetical protein